jgi:peptidoglycan/LPS O-acetylase OafA/YrhL
MRPKTIEALDGVRGIAILLVMFYHFTFRFTPTSLSGRLVAAMGAIGWCGVDLFFVLSGFLITGILLRAKGSAGYYRNFYMRRLLRIFPLYYALLLVLFVLLPLVFPFEGKELSALEARQGWLWTYTSNIAIAFSGKWLFNVEHVQLNHLWSLAVEEHFYFVWPFLVGWLERRTLLRVCAGILVGAPVLRLVLLALKAPLASYVLSPCRMDALALGGVVAVLIADPRAHALMAKHAKQALLGGVLVTVAIVAVRRNADHYGWLMETIGFPALAIAAAGLLLVAHGSRAGALSHRVLTFRPLMTAGKYSYGAYVFHQVLQPAFEKYAGPARFAPLPDGLAMLLHVAIAVTASFAVAVVSFHVFEERFLGLKRFFEYNGPREAPDGATSDRRSTESPGCPTPS